MPNQSSQPNVIDLFSGVGGLSLGAARSGMRVAASVELDGIASRSHALNFPNTKHLQWDISKLGGSDLLDAAELDRRSLQGLIGGPPCQGFSQMGKRKPSDTRNDLFGHFFRLVNETLPAFYVVENVPGILAEANRYMLERALRDVPSIYVQLEPLRVEAHRFGAATTRTRIFFIGFDPSRMQALTEADFAPSSSTRTINVREALAGLPSVRPTWQKESQSWRRVRQLPNTDFSRKLVADIPSGVGNIEALNRLKKKQEVSGFLGTKHTLETVARFAALKPGEIDRVYRSPRLVFEGFCPTLRAGTGKERGSYQAVRPIHPRFPRVISPREAARLQGFPDWFVFDATKWHAFRQIGNSVSPIVAESILKRLACALQ